MTERRIEGKASLLKRVALAPVIGASALTVEAVHTGFYIVGFTVFSNSLAKSGLDKDQMDKAFSIGSAKIWRAAEVGIKNGSYRAFLKSLDIF
jgi:hypothetical protein